MVTIDVEYAGDLRCTAQHGPSGMVITTDAPKDNMGQGAAFSPTDLCAASLLTCVVTTMGIAAKKNGFELGSCTARVEKIMTAVPTRRIASLPIHIELADAYSPEQQAVLQHAAETCPVKESLSPTITIPITWEYC